MTLAERIRARAVLPKRAPNRVQLRKISLLLILSSLFACGDTVPGTESIDERLARLFPEDPTFGIVDRDRVREMMAVPPEEDGPFFLVNFIAYRERAAYPDGRPSELTGAEADALYGHAVLPILLQIGARPVFVALVETILNRDDDVAWDQIAVVRYPSRAAFLGMLERDDFKAAAEHKEAGVETTLVLVAEPTADVWPEGLRQVDVAATPYPPGRDEPPVAIIHLYAYRERAEYPDGRATDLSGREAVDLYSQGRADQDVQNLGVRPGLWLELDGGILTDPRSWNEFRVNLFPSREAFWVVAGSAAEAGIEHRAAGLAHAYSLITRPVLNEFGYE